MKKHVKLSDSTSNNEAEYDILLHGLQVCVSLKIWRLMVKGDVLLIVKQILGIWACKNERLKEKVQAIRRLFNQFEEVADFLAQKAVACDESEVQVILAATAIKQPRYQEMESLAPIVSYILEGKFPQSFTKAQKQRLMEKASSYLFLEGALYQRGKGQVCRRIPTMEEIPSILEGLHEEACGGHFAQELTAKKKLLSGWQGPYTVKKAFNSSYYELMDLNGKEHSKKVNGYRLKPYLSRILQKDLQEYQSATLPCYVQTGDDIAHPIVQTSDIPLSTRNGKEKYLVDVLHVPNITKNLI
ncbi:hypothetical protein L7F22_013440 [Adiantum nelumboides]|nr:hypothetical protein [Adiantum nelumboides]